MTIKQSVRTLITAAGIFCAGLLWIVLSVAPASAQTPIPPPTQNPSATQVTSPTVVPTAAYIELPPATPAPPVPITSPTPTTQVAPTAIPVNTATAVPTPQVIAPVPAVVVTPAGAAPTPTATAVAINRNEGELDRNFGSGGIVRTSISGDVQQVVAFGRDLFVVISSSRSCGSFLEACNDTLTIARFRADGTADVRFGDAGKFTLSGPFYGFTNVVIQSDGKFVVGVGSLPQSRKPGLLRLTSDGLFDRTFGNNGQVATDIVVDGSRHPLQPKSIALLNDGRIVFTGSERIVDGFVNTQQFFVARLTRYGQFDTTFGKNGVVRRRDISSSDDESFGTRVLVQPTGYIVTLGLTGSQGSFGTFIHQFSNFGKVLFPSTFAKNTLPPRNPTCNNNWLDGRMKADGHIVVFRDPNGPPCDGIFYQLNADMSLDNDVDVLTGSLPSIAAFQSDGKIIGAGIAAVDTGEGNDAVYALTVTRYFADGRLDTSFGDDSVASTGGALSSYRRSQQSAMPVAVTQLDGKIIVAGTLQSGSGSSSTSTIVLARFVGKATRTLDLYVPILMSR